MDPHDSASGALGYKARRALIEGSKRLTRENLARREKEREGEGQEQGTQDLSPATVSESTNKRKRCEEDNSEHHDSVSSAFLAEAWEKDKCGAKCVVGGNA